MQTRAVVFALTTIVSAAFADLPKAKQTERYAKFASQLSKDDYKAAERVLLEWQSASRTDVELAVAWANLYSQQAALPIELSAGAPPEHGVKPDEAGVFPLQKSGTTETAGFIDTRPRYDDRLLTRALSVLRDAATTHPQRTDIWMGATHVQMQAQDLDGAFETLRQFAKYVHEHPKGLQTRFDEPLKDKAEDFMPRTLHAYAVRGNDEQTSEGMEFLLKVARLAQELYPKHPYAYNDEAIYYSALEDDARVLECLLRAHAVRPRDAVVIMNIAATHKNLKQKDKAREFYRLAIKTTDDAELKAAAREELEGLE